MNIITRITAPFSNFISVISKPGNTPKMGGRQDRVGKSKRAEGAQNQSVNPYRATYINHQDCACEAVKAISNKRFLVSKGKTPLLPLANCDVSVCGCRYVHCNDRRDNDGDRRIFKSLKTDLYEESGEEDLRSKKRGRRSTDL